MAEHRADIYTRITAEIIAAIEAGAGQWRMPWHHDGGSIARPTNVALLQALPRRQHARPLATSTSTATQQSVQKLPLHAGWETFTCTKFTRRLIMIYKLV
ncbi:MAG: ArdC-like ssDNA-binding domain-containing protein, partial [Allosphingosinicella sp.]